MNPTMTKEELLAFLELREQSVRELILEKGRVLPFVELLCPTKNIDSVRGSLNVVALDKKKPGWELGVGVVMIPMSIFAPDLLDLYEGTLEDPTKREALAMLRAVGAGGRTKEKADEFILRTLCAMGGNCEPQDIFELCIRSLASKLEAYAMVRSSEAWMMTVEGIDKEHAVALREAEKYPDMKDHPLSAECLLMLIEARSFSRMSRIPIHREREKDETSRIIALGPTEHSPEDGTIEGRMSGAIREAVQ